MRTEQKPTPRKTPPLATITPDQVPWRPAQHDIEVAASLLKHHLILPQSLAGTRQPDLKDMRAIVALSTALDYCLPVLPPEVADLARQYAQAVQDAYHEPA